MFWGSIFIDDGAEPGVAGLYNMGNTCFMNAGLQCLFSNGQLVKHMLEDNTTLANIDETLTEKYEALLRKVWMGQYSIIYPEQFKQILGIYHPQFKDYRQVFLHFLCIICDCPCKQIYAHNSEFLLLLSA